MDTAVQSASKPFLVEGGPGGMQIFRVVEVEENIPHGLIERLLERLPILFHLCEDVEGGHGVLHGPVDVHVQRNLLRIYPSRHRIIACTSFCGLDPNRSTMRVDNVMDTLFPGRGQLRTCVHFNPGALGVTGWPIAGTEELELDIHMYPEGTEREQKLKVPSFNNHEVKELLDLIAGGGQTITVEQVQKWRRIILFAVASMRSGYENPDVPEDYPVRVYYKPVWEAIDAAKGSDGELVKALEQLRSSIQWQ